jgi:dCMP deaminase
MFITHSPCKMCAKAIINAGIVEVYFENKYRDSEPLQLLKLAKIKVFHYKDTGLEEFKDAT